MSRDSSEIHHESTMKRSKSGQTCACGELNARTCSDQELYNFEHTPEAFTNSTVALPKTFHAVSPAFNLGRLQKFAVPGGGEAPVFSDQRTNNVFGTSLSTRVKTGTPAAHPVRFRPQVDPPISSHTGRISRNGQKPS